MTKSTGSINLFKKEEKTFFEKFLDWALNIGRILVIFTEGIALAAFLYRFTLDMQLVDLHDKIAQQQQIVASYKNEELKYRDLQDKLALIKQVGNRAADRKQIVSDLVGFGQGNAVFNGLSISGSTLKIDASTTSITALSAFINALRAYGNINSVSLDKVEKKADTGIIDVIVSAKLKPAFVENTAEE